MTAYVVVDIEIKDPVRYEEYKQLAPQSLAAFGGKYVARGGKTDVLEGARRPGRVVLLEFPNAKRAREWWDSEAYKPVKGIRQACARTEMFIVEGV